MIRTKTTLVVGAGTALELQMPTNADLLSRIAQGFEFVRLGTETETRDNVLLAGYLSKAAGRLGKGDDDARLAAERIRQATKIGRSLDSIIDQHDTEPLIALCGKLAIVHYVCQGEARSLLRPEPRFAGDLPIQGTDTWLYQLGQLITDGVPRSRIDQCFNELTIINFNYDRAIEHFMPFALNLAFGMTLKEAQQLVAAKLRIFHPQGAIGRLPWQQSDAPEVEWGTEQPWNIHNLAVQIRSPAETARDQRNVQAIRGAVAGAKRLVFLGFGYQPQSIDLLIDYSLSHDPEILASVSDHPKAIQASIQRVLKRKTGIDREDLVMLVDSRSNDVLRDYSLLLES